MPILKNLKYGLAGAALMASVATFSSFAYAQGLYPTASATISPTPLMLNTVSPSASIDIFGSITPSPSTLENNISTPTPSESPVASISATSTSTPGLPRTGRGSNAADAWVLLVAAGVVAAGSAYLVRRNS